MGDSLEFERVAASAANALFGAAAPMPKLGRFELGRRLGRGGMGTVYEAHDPDLGRSVALKVVRAPASSEQPTEQVLAEARAAAKVDHPNVVKVFESGVEGERIYIAMERVDGDDLGTWLAVERPSWLEIVEVFIRIARGLHAVHEAGVIHRDFKPANVIVANVDGRPEPRVVDFGLATTREASLLQRAGTLGYMSPEQLAGEALTDKTDQFAFFVSLHEALGKTAPPQPTPPSPAGSDGTAETDDTAGTAEWRGLATWSDEARRRWLEQWRRTFGPPALRDIIRRGTQAEASARFPDMGAVAEALTRVPKARRRRRVALAVTPLVLLGAVAVGAAAYDPCAAAEEPWADVYSDERSEALRRGFEEATPIYAEQTHDAVDGLLERWGMAWTDSSRRVCESQPRFARRDADDSRRRCLDRRLVEVDTVLEKLEQPNAQRVHEAASVVADLTDPSVCLRPRGGSSVAAPAGSVELLAASQAHISFNELPQAAAVLDELDETLDGEPAPPDILLQSRLHRAVVQDRRGEYPESRKELRAVFNELVALGLDALAARAATELIWTAGYQMNDLPAAERWNGIADAFERRGSLGDAATSRRLDRFATALFRAGEYERAYDMHQDALELARKVWGDESPVLFPYLLHLSAAAYRLPGRTSEAVEYNERALALAETVYGPDHPTVALALTNRRVPLEPDSCERALPDIERAIDIKRRVFGERSPKLSSTLNKLGNCQGVLGNHEQAIATIREALAVVEQNSGPDDPRVAIYSVNIARSLMELGKPEDLDQAEIELERALAVDRGRLGEDHWEILYSLVGLLDVDLRYRATTSDATQQRLTEADRILALGECADPSLQVLLELAHARHEWISGRSEQAQTWLETARATRERESLDLMDPEIERAEALLASRSAR